MTDSRGVLFVPYQDTLALLSVEDALRICEEVYGMHARGSVVLSSPASFKLDVAEGFNNHWHVKSAFLKDIPTTGVRLYNYYDDGVRNTVGNLGCTRYIALSDPHSGEPLAIRRALELRHPQRGGRDPRLQVDGPQKPENPRSRRHRHDGDEFAALSLHHVPVRGDPLHLAPPRDAGGVCAEMVAGARNRGRAQGFDRRGRARRRYRRWRHHFERRGEPRALAQARLDLHLAGAPRARSGRLVEDGQGRHRQLGLQHAAGRVQADDRVGSVLARAAPWRDPRAGIGREEGPRAR